MLFCPNADCPDLQESGNPAEYREGLTTCPICGSALVRNPPEGLGRW